MPKDSANDYTKAWEDAIKNQAQSDVDLDDGLENVLTGMGTGIDKSTANTWVHSGKNLDHVQLAARFREDWISQKVCTIVPQDMTREWRTPNTKEGIDADVELGDRKSVV